MIAPAISIAGVVLEYDGEVWTVSAPSESPPGLEEYTASPTAVPAFSYFLGRVARRLESLQWDGDDEDGDSPERELLDVLCLGRFSGRPEPVGVFEVRDGKIDEYRKIGPTPPDGTYLLVPAPEEGP